MRRTRWALVRNTYPELISTTLNTFRDWIPEQVCPITLSTPVGGTLRVNLPDGTRVEAEFIFLALDSEDDGIEFSGGEEGEHMSASHAGGESHEEIRSDLKMV